MKAAIAFAILIANLIAISVLAHRKRRERTATIFAAAALGVSVYASVRGI